MSTDYPPLHLATIQQQLANTPIGHTLSYHRTIPSTMPIAAEIAKDPTSPSGIVVVAEEQTSGRGRRGRSWHTPYASALLTSIILKPPHTNLPPAHYTMLAGNAILAAATAVAPELQGQLHLKWPNDLVFSKESDTNPATARKVAGILVESSITPDGTMDYAILGIGTNVNQTSNDLPRIAPPTPRPISLRVATGRTIDRSELLIQLCRQLAQSLTLTTPESYQQSYHQWKSNLATLGQSVAIYANGTEQPPTHIGQAIDVQEDGALIIQDESGTSHTFYAADVSVRAL